MTPPLPPGYELEGGPPRPGANLLDPLTGAGVDFTSGFRTPQDTARIRQQGYSPAAGGAHEHGDGIDLTPGRSGWSMRRLEFEARKLAKPYSNAKIINEGHHIHFAIPGWGMAPGTPGTPNFGLPALPPGYELEQRGSLVGEDFGAAPASPQPSVFTAPMSPRAAKALSPQVPESTIEALRARTIMHPDNFAPESSIPSWVIPTAPMTTARELENLNRLTNPGAFAPPPAPRIGIAPAINAVRARITGEQLPTEGDTTQSIGGFFDELPEEMRRKLTTEQIEQYLALARKGPKAADLESMFQGFGFDIQNAADIEKAIAKGAAANKAIAYKQREVTNPDGATGSFLRGLGDPINFIDEAGGVADTLGLTDGRESVWNSQRSFGDILDSNIDENRAILGADERNHPYARLGGQLTSGLILPYGAGARTAGQLAKVGAVEGAAAGLGAGEGNLLNRAPNAALGAGFGAAGGAAMGKAIDGGAAVWNAARNRLMRGAAPDALNVGREAAYEAAPVIDDTLQAAGPTPASRYQPQGGAVHPGSAAMRMEDQAPELVGQLRQRDYIDVGGVPPLPPGYISDTLGKLKPVAEADPARLAKLAEGIGPSDVLPVPRNYVASMDEAISANPGSVQPVEAGDEFATLSTRRFPSASGTRYQRGPVDLVGFLRSQGGVQDQGGELSHLGISNARRKDDFTGAETFLGRLVGKEGMALDDAAHKAWEAGYFPDHHEPPSVPDFLDALHGTFTGFNRRFLPDDLAELGQFEAARGQRETVEAAAQDGRVLAEDVGQPIGPDDLEANQPPSTAYEDLDEEISKVANINLAKIETPKDIGRALQAITNAAGSKRRTVSFAQMEEEAKGLNLTVGDLMKRREGQALNAPEALATRQLFAASINDTVTRAQKAIGGSDTDKADFLKSMLLSAAIRDHAEGAAAEAGRALGQYRMIAKATRSQSEAIRQLIHNRGGHESVESMAEALIELSVDPDNAGRFLQKVTKPGAKDMFNEYYINALVSGLTTHAVNIVSNLVTMGLQLPEHALAAGVGAARSAVTKSTDKVYFSELGPRLVGMLQGARTGLRNAKVAIKTGRASDDSHKIESRFQHAIPGKLGHVIRTPTRLLTAEDEFAKGMALGSELAGAAHRRAKAEGLRGEALSARIAELNANPSNEMMRGAKDYARYVTYQRQLGALGTSVSRLSNELPGLKIVIPFVRTPTNLLKFAVERSPAAPLLKEWRADMLAGGARRDLAVVRASSGTALGALAASWAASGVITGGGPADDNARRSLMADGWQPYSIKIGDKYVSYARLDPLATTLGMAADFSDKSSQMTPRQAEEYAAMISGTVMKNLESKVWLSGMADLLQAVEDSERFGPSYIRRVMATIAVPVGVNQVAQTLDTTPREAKTVGEQIKSRIPGLSDDLRPRLDAWGRPVVQEGRLGPDILSPFYQSTRRDEPINKEALRLNLKVSRPSRDITDKAAPGGKRRLSDEEFHAYQMRAGQMLTQRFDALMRSPQWKGLSDPAKVKRFDKLKDASRKDARRALGMFASGAPRSASPATPPTSAPPPLPPGYVLEGVR